MTTSDVVWGVNGHPISQAPYTSISDAQQMEMIKAEGLTSYRVDIYDASSASMDALSNLIAAGKEYGVSILPILIPDPLSYGSATDAYNAGYAMANAYAKAFPGMTWEMGNEWDNLAINPGASGANASDYNAADMNLIVGMLKGMTAGMQAGDPTAQSMIDNAGWFHYGFLQLLAQNGVTWNITAEHWYSDMGNMTNVGGSGTNALAELAQLGHPIEITEFNERGGSAGGISAEASDLVATMQEVDSLASTYHITAGYIYELMNQDQLGSGEGTYGLYNSNGTMNAAGQAVESFLASNPSASPFGASTAGTGSSTPPADPPTPSANGATLAAGASGTLATAAGTWSFGAAGYGGDEILLNGVQAANGFATELAVEDGGHLFALNSVGQWYEWSGSAWATATDPLAATTSTSGSTTSTTSSTSTSGSGSTSTSTSASGSTSSSGLAADGATLEGTSGHLVTADGTWSFGAAGYGGNEILLNGAQVANGFATELAVEDGGHVFALNSVGQWYEWTGSGWATTTDPLTSTSTSTSSSTSTTTSTSGSTSSSGLAADGATLEGTSGHLVTAAGTWSFGAAGYGGDQILLNGVHVANGFATELAVEDGGHLFALNSVGQWYEWSGSGWAPTSDPIPTAGASTAATAATSTAGTTVPAGVDPPASDTLHIHVSAEAFHGDAMMEVFVDGTEVGSPIAITADHALHQAQDVVLSGNFSGAEHVSIELANPTSGGTPGAETALYVQSIQLDAHAYAGTGGADAASGGQATSGASVVAAAGADVFTVTGSAIATSPPSAHATFAPAAAMNPAFVDAAGQDVFVFSSLAQAHSGISSFDPGHDVIDLAPILHAIGYHGTDPFGDHVVGLEASGANTVVMVDPHGVDPAHGTALVTLHNVAPSHVPAADFWH